MTKIRIFAPMAAALAFALAGVQAAEPDAGDAAQARELAKDLKDPDKGVRLKAAKRLGDLGPASNDAVRALAEALGSDSSAEVRALAASALGQIGIRAKLEGEDPVPSLAKEGVSALTKALDDEDVTVRHRAVGGLAWVGPAAKTAVPRLILMLKGKEETPDKVKVASTVAETLGRIGPAAKEAIPHLIQVTQDEDKQLARVSAIALGWIGLLDDRVLPTLLRLLSDSANPPVQDGAADAIRVIGPDAKEAMPSLIRLLEDKPWKDAKVAEAVSLTVLSAIAAMGPEAKDAVPILAATIVDIKLGESVRSRSAYALSKIGAEAKAAIPELVEVFSARRDPINGSYVKAALLKIGAPAVPLLAKEMEKALPQDRSKFIDLFQEMGSAAKEAIPALKRQIDVPGIGSDPKRAIEKIEQQPR